MAYHFIASKKRLFQYIRQTTAGNLPSRYRLSNTIMDRLSERSRTPRLASLKKDVKAGRIVNLICHGWETKNKKHINGVFFQSGSQWVTSCNENGIFWS